MKRSAQFSPCRNFRYLLWRSWGDPVETDMGYPLFISPHASVAEIQQDEPLVMRCIDLARRWGYGRMCLAHLFAYRARNSADLLSAPDPVGTCNDELLALAAAGATVVVAAWGPMGSYRDRDQQIQAMLPELSCLGQSRAGHPLHPLFVLPDAPLTPFTPKEPVSPPRGLHTLRIGAGHGARTGSASDVTSGEREMSLAVAVPC